MANELPWFKHDTNAQHDPKIVRLMMAHGWEGYGIFWGLVEKLYTEGGEIRKPRIPIDRRKMHPLTRTNLPPRPILAGAAVAALFWREWHG